MSGRDFSLNDIHLALDGELSADDRADFEHWLDAHPDMKALSVRYERDRETLAAALAGCPRRARAGEAHDDGPG